MKNITALRKELSIVFMDLKSGDIEPKTAKQMNNAAGKIINTVKAQMEYATLRQEQPNIPFLK